MKTSSPSPARNRGSEFPTNVSTVTVRAHDSVHGFGGREMTVDLDALR
jgi:hypothetical protein